MSSLTPPPLTRLENEARQDRRALRWQARRVLWNESALKRVRFCGIDPVQNRGIVLRVSGTGTAARAGFTGLQHCGSTWACPVCASKIASVRADEIGRAVSEWADRGGRLVFLTLTMRHSAKQQLEHCWDAVAGAWHKATSGRGYERDHHLYGTYQSRRVLSGANEGKIVAGRRINFVKVTEVTHGRNGWHVHIHAILFLRGDVGQAGALALGASMFKRWKAALIASGFQAPSTLRGVDVRLVEPKDGSPLAQYFAKNTYAGAKHASSLGYEASGGTGKVGREGGHRTPFQILGDIVVLGEVKDLSLWRQWEYTSRGRRQMAFSAGLRDLLDLGEELTDEEIAAEDMAGEDVLAVTAEDWKVLRWQAETVLTLAETDLDGARRFICELTGWRPAVAEYCGPPAGASL